MEDSIVGGGKDLYHKRVKKRKKKVQKHEVDLWFSIKNVAQFITFLFESFSLPHSFAFAFLRHEDSLSIFIPPQTPPSLLVNIIPSIIQHGAEKHKLHTNV